MESVVASIMVNATDPGKVARVLVLAEHCAVFLGKKLSSGALIMSLFTSKLKKIESVQPCFIGFSRVLCVSRSQFLSRSISLTGIFLY